MRIVHISDLHFGSHNQFLANALKRRMQTLQPDLILVTGDLANEPEAHLFEEARQYLRQLEDCCSQAPQHDLTRPRLLCIPGNHDVLPSGYQPIQWRRLSWFVSLIISVFKGEKLPKIPSKAARRATYSEFFSDIQSTYYFRPENVWVFGFDSVHSKLIGGGGAISEQELDQFHSTCDELNSQYSKDFKSAFKILAIHHHPLPVNWHSDWKQRWLTMSNAGSLLAGALHRNINLILHGHEHRKAHSRLRSTLSGNAHSELQIVSLGATLATETPDGRNWYNVIEVEQTGVVKLTSFPSYQQEFEAEGKLVVLRSHEEAFDGKFEIWKQNAGFAYDRITSITILDKDGDARRVVECNGLHILDAATTRAENHQITMSYTSGYIDVPEVHQGVGCNLAGIHFAENPPNRTERHKILKRTIRWSNRTLQVDERVDYRYSWFAVNSFAMNDLQFQCKYSDGSGMEFTHFVVEDPIEDLTIVVQFPNGFNLLSLPEIRVSRYDSSTSAREWQQDYESALKLHKNGRLRYIESIKMAELYIHRPIKGFSYGIQWKVPDSSPQYNTPHALAIRSVVSTLLREDDTAAVVQQRLEDYLLRVSIIVRAVVGMGNWPSILECTFMIFDFQSRMLKIAGYICTQNESGGLTCFQETSASRNTQLEYGDGIGGRAYKANEYRLYIEPHSRQHEPDYYHQVLGSEPHKVVLSMPIRNPVDSNHAYGVLTFASTDAGCPLANLASNDWRPPGSNRTKSKLGDMLIELQKRFDQLAYNSFS